MSARSLVYLFDRQLEEKGLIYRYISRVFVDFYLFLEYHVIFRYY